MSVLNGKMGLWLELFGKVGRFVRSLFVVTFPLQVGISMMASVSLLNKLVQKGEPKGILPSNQSSY